MSSTEFDAIVIGAGMAGLCCAGELTLQGARTLLIAETKQVGASVRATRIDGNIGLMQVPTNMVGWGGGWWAPLARRLNVPVRTPLGFNAFTYDLLFEGQRDLLKMPGNTISAASLTDAACSVIPGIEANRKEIERVLHAGFSIDYTDLAEMDDVPLRQWLAEQGADEMTSGLIFTLANAGLASTTAFAQEHLSVFGGIGVIRTFFSSEATFGAVYPDNRLGLAMPLAEGIERHGGTVWRASRVAHVDTSGGRVGVVTLSDGRTVSAPMVALACTNARITDLLDELPIEAQPAIDYSEKTKHRDYHAFALLDREVLPFGSSQARGILRPDGSLALYAFNCHETPWAMSPDSAAKQLVVAGCCRPAGEDHGSDEEIFAGLHDLMDWMAPGYKAATIETRNVSHKPGHLWFENMLHGPKLPRRSSSVDGLWFVSQASRPTHGMYMEAGSSAGVLGARAMVAELRS